MCGIAGYYGPKSGGSSEVICKMSRALAHRGPDGAGEWVDINAGIGLGHRRLSIVDTSSAGHQPMVSASGRYVIAFNGEIYNHRSLRSRLASLGHAPVWRGHSDTESLLAVIEAWGIEVALEEAGGMFALALWDRSKETLSLARDRFGEKPLYYGAFGSTLLFGSELGALRAHPCFEARIDRAALDDLVRYGFVSGDRSIYRNIRQLPPGTWISICSEGEISTPNAYWDTSHVLKVARTNPFLGSYEQAVCALESRLSAAVASQLESDVPLGSFLSGGIDSTVVCGLAQRHSKQSLRTFSIGFSDSGYDEAEHAAAVARHLGTEHTELYVGQGEARDLVPDLMAVYDQPFADASAIPTTLLARLTRQHVTVALSGDGGDELFGGYNRYVFGAELWRRVQRVPKPLRRPLAALLLRVSPQRWDQAVGAFLTQAFKNHMPDRLGEKIHKAANGMQAQNIHAFHKSILRRSAESPVIGVPVNFDTAATEGSAVGVEEQLMHADMVGYLPDDILVKVDRAAMSAGLETRVPMLDKDLAEFAMSLPIEFKIRGAVGKRVLRDVAYRLVPQSLMDRPKAGFDVPLGAWLRGNLRDWAQTQLAPSRLRAQGYFHEPTITRAWCDHLARRADNTDVLWPVLMFESWLESAHDTKAMKAC